MNFQERRLGFPKRAYFWKFIMMATLGEWSKDGLTKIGSLRGKIQMEDTKVDDHLPISSEIRSKKIFYKIFSPPKILLQDSLACFWLGGYFYPRLLIGRIFFIRGFWLGGYLSGCQCQPRHITARFAPNRPGIFALIPSPQDTSISLGEFKSSRSFQ